MVNNTSSTQRKLTLEDRLLQRLPFAAQIDALDQRVTAWMARYGLVMMRIALGVIFFWFGALKLFPGLSPAEDLVRNTIFFIDPNVFQPLLAVWEMAIGLGLITGMFMRVTLLLLFLQMPGTALPIIITPEAVFTMFPFGLTIEGQYIVKNLALITAAIVLGSTVRGGRIVPQP
ncbi:MAG: DoxX family membrane protein [Caldilinea sp.]|jgi:uncharacterized membrane protein YphA (DoxX/SURF4 family)|nr:DoxX family membrane protein [Caldilinea sp.]